ncbi:hypothetical protein [Bradyrhizobium sp. S69]|uniref:hypothetical protein n=1 Tax=Bradyrhizobium sp. S69 TaxID=1641856 RepID=UPI00131EBB31|nr:hypothetical protein [Bradyrhizobium sp. S69]
MLRAIFAAMASGIRKLFGFAYSFVTWPFALFGGRARRQSAGIDLGAAKAVEDKVAAVGMKPADSTSSHLRDSQMRDAQIAWSWITTSMLTRQPMPVPSALSKTMKSWLQGLDHGQLTALQNADAKGLFEHSIGKHAIASVPRVQPLAMVSIVFPRIAARKSDDEIADLRSSPA